METLKFNTIYTTGDLKCGENPDRESCDLIIDTVVQAVNCLQTNKRPNKLEPNDMFVDGDVYISNVIFSNKMNK